MRDISKFFSEARALGDLQPYALPPMMSLGSQRTALLPATEHKLELLRNLEVVDDAVVGEK